MSESEPTARREGLSRVKLERLFRHQQWLNTNGRFGAQLVLRVKGGASGKSFQNHNLDGVDLSRAVIEGIAFSRSSLRGARLAGADLKRVLFYQCDLEGADFSNSTLNDVSFERSNYVLAKFDNAETTRVKWQADEPQPPASGNSLTLRHNKL